MAFPFRNMQNFIRNCIEPHTVAMRSQLDAMTVILKNIVNDGNLPEVNPDSLNYTLTYKSTSPPANTNFLWLNTVDATLNYYDDKLAKWVSIVGRYSNTP